MSIRPGIIGHGHVAVLPLRVTLRHEKKKSVHSFDRARCSKQPNSRTDRYDSMITASILLESRMESANIELINSGCIVQFPRFKTQFSGISGKWLSPNKIYPKKISLKVKSSKLKNLKVKSYIKKKKGFFESLNNLKITTLFFVI